MKLVIIGAVAAGTSAAAKARRNTEDAEIVIYERDSWISYSGCGMPYFLGGDIADADELTPRNPEFFWTKYRVAVHTRHEVLRIDPNSKTLHVQDTASGREFTDTYDVLILATGASAVLPPVPGAESEHVFSLRTIGDMHNIHTYLQRAEPKSAVIVGSGFIGLEMAENLVHRGLQVKVVEMLPQVTPGLDSDMACYVEHHVREHGVEVYTDVSAAGISGSQVTLSDGTVLQADMVLMATGVRPNTRLAEAAGIKLGSTGAIQVDRRMRTDLPDIYACGDCSEQFHVVTGQPVYRPLGSTANKTGRIAGDCATGGSLEFRGVLGTGIFRVFDLTVAQTGLSQRESELLGYDTVVCHNTKPDKPTYMHGTEMTIKGIADRATGRLLGVQIVGRDGVDKRLDVFATAISFKACVEDLFHLDLGYAPPYSTTKDPVLYTGMILSNAISGGRALITADQLKELQRSGSRVQLVDARAAAQYARNHIESALSLPHAEFRDKIHELDPNAVSVTYCNKGTTGNAAQNILLNSGFSSVYNLSGGHKHYTTQDKK
ncbi:MAG: FAD-dependent oxidoreductase [Spirochaeta sp.]